MELHTDVDSISWAEFVAALPERRAATAVGRERPAAPPAAPGAGRAWLPRLPPAPGADGAGHAGIAWGLKLINSQPPL